MKTCVVAGGSRNLGKHIVKNLARHGNRVIFTSSSYPNVYNTMADLQQENIIGIKCDHQKIKDIEYLVEREPKVDILINNFAVSGGYKSFRDVSKDDIIRIVMNNLIGNMLTTKIFLDRYPDIDIFNIVGAGSDGSATPYYSVYGSTKCAITQFTKSLYREGYENIHLLSPGMMQTDLLMEGTPEYLHNIFDVICEDSNVIAAKIVPDVLDIHNKKKKRQYMRYINPLTIASKIIKQFKI